MTMKRNRETNKFKIQGLIDELPESEKKLLNSMKDEQRYKYWEKHYNILKSRT